MNDTMTVGVVTILSNGTTDGREWSVVRDQDGNEGFTTGLKEINKIYRCVQFKGVGEFKGKDDKMFQKKTRYVLADKPMEI